MLRHVVFWLCANVSVEHSASIFSKIAAQRNDYEDKHQYPHRRENLKSYNICPLTLSLINDVVPTAQFIWHRTRMSFWVGHERYQTWSFSVTL
jgi:hypothetical protein